MTDKEKLVELIEESTGCTYGGEYGDEVVENEIDITDEEIERIANYLLANGVVVQKHGAFRVKITTDDFTDTELARNKGWYNKHYFCPSCNQELKTETYEKDHCFGSWCAVSGKIPMHNCPNCGTKMEEQAWSNTKIRKR